MNIKNNILRTFLILALTLFQVDSADARTKKSKASSSSRNRSRSSRSTPTKSVKISSSNNRNSRLSVRQKNSTQNKQKYNGNMSYHSVDRKKKDNIYSNRKKELENDKKLLENDNKRINRDNLYDRNRYPYDQEDREEEYGYQDFGAGSFAGGGQSSMLDSMLRSQDNQIGQNPEVEVTINNSRDKERPLKKAVRKPKAKEDIKIPIIDLFGDYKRFGFSYIGLIDRRFNGVASESLQTTITDFTNNGILTDVFKGDVMLENIFRFDFAIGSSNKNFVTKEFEFSVISMNGNLSNIQSVGSYLSEGLTFNDFEGPDLIKSTLFNASFNIYYDFLRNELIENTSFFIGGGLGIGYINNQSAYLEPNFVAPTGQIMLGIRFINTKSTKLSIVSKTILFYPTPYNNSTFPTDVDTSATTRSIENGQFSIEDAFISTIGIEFSRY